ncbi:MAG TPA: hypothetical protein VF155_09665, partial [Candidatus Dormibacteraeota bacterium]
MGELAVAVRPPLVSAAGGPCWPGGPCFAGCDVAFVFVGWYERSGRDLSWWVSDETTGGDAVAAEAAAEADGSRPMTIDAAA